jgi:Bacterial Ig domain
MTNHKKELLRLNAVLPAVRATVFCLAMALLAPRLLAQALPPMPPYAGDDYAYSDSHTSVSVCVVANDYGYSAPIDPSSVTITSPPGTGTATVDGTTGSIQFTPDPGASVADLLSYQVSDADGRVSNEATLWISVLHFPPHADGDATMTSYVESATIDVLSNDSRGTAPIDPGSVTIVTPPSNGSVSVDNISGDVTYTPDDMFSGTDWFEYTVSDTDGVVSDAARVDVYVMNASPMISWMSAWMDAYGIWVVEGELQDERPETVTVAFGGLASGTATPDATGHFQTTVSVPPGTYGYATAVATDELGLQSAESRATIYNY